MRTSIKIDQLITITLKISGSELELLKKQLNRSHIPSDVEEARVWRAFINIFGGTFDTRESG